MVQDLARLYKVDEEYSIYGTHKPEGLCIGFAFQLYIGCAVHLGGSLRILTNHVWCHNRIELFGFGGGVNAVVTV